MAYPIYKVLIKIMEIYQLIKYLLMKKGGLKLVNKYSWKIKIVYMIKYFFFLEQFLFFYFIN